MNRSAEIETVTTDDLRALHTCLGGAHVRWLQLLAIGNPRRTGDRRNWKSPGREPGELCGFGRPVTSMTPLAQYLGCDQPTSAPTRVARDELRNQLDADEDS